MSKQKKYVTPLLYEGLKPEKNVMKDFVALTKNRMFDKSGVNEEYLIIANQKQLTDEAKRGNWPSKIIMEYFAMLDMIGMSSFYYDAPIIFSNYFSERKDLLKEKFNHDMTFNMLRKVGPDVQLMLNILRVIWSEAQSGDSFSSSFLIQIYKTYYKKEYNWHKRFKYLTVDDLYDVVLEDNKNGTSVYTVILSMSEFMDIELDPQLAGLYTITNHRAEKLENFYASKNDLTDEELDEADKMLVNILSDNPKDKLNDLALRSIEDFLDVYGLDDSYPEFCKGFINQFNLRSSADYVLASIKRRHPNKEITENEIHILTLIYGFLNMFIETTNTMNNLFYSGFGIVDDKETNWKYFMNVPSRKKVQPEPMKNEDSEMKEQTLKLEKQIESLNSSLLRKDEDIDKLWNDIRLLKKELEKKDEEIEELKNDQYELRHLREYVYDMTEEDELEVVTETMDDMKNKLADKNIIIIGGLPSWQKRLNEMFPKWKFFDVNYNMNASKNALINSDMVFFYTKYVSHQACNEVIHCIKDNNLNYGYINGSNVEKLLRQVSDAMQREGVF